MINCWAFAGCVQLFLPKTESLLPWKAPHMMDIKYLLASGTGVCSSHLSLQKEAVWNAKKAWGSLKFIFLRGGNKKVIFRCQNCSYKETFEVRARGNFPGHPIQPLQQCKQVSCIIQFINGLSSTLKNIKLFLFLSSFTAAMGRLL